MQSLAAPACQSIFQKEHLHSWMPKIFPENLTNIGSVAKNRTRTINNSCTREFLLLVLINDCLAVS